MTRKMRRTRSLEQLIRCNRIGNRSSGWRRGKGICQKKKRARLPMAADGALVLDRRRCSASALLVALTIQETGNVGRRRAVISGGRGARPLVRATGQARHPLEQRAAGGDARRDRGL